MPIPRKISRACRSFLLFPCEEHTGEGCSDAVVRLASVTRSNQSIQSAKAVIFPDPIRNAINFDIGASRSEIIVNRGGHYPGHISTKSQPDALSRVATPSSQRKILELNIEYSANANQFSIESLWIPYEVASAHLNWTFLRTNQGWRT